MSKLRILFVDDEQPILDGLRRQLRPMRQEWETAFASSAREAIALHEAQPFDVVVSDIRMPGMDGVELLEHIKGATPSTVRVALSGHSEQQELLRAAGTVHRYLAKPCEPDALRATIHRTRALREVLEQPDLLRLVASLGKLPSLPSIYQELLREMQSPKSSAARVGAIIKRDLGMATKVLQLVNSSFFGLRGTIADPVQATVILGTETVRALVIQAHLYEQVGSRSPGGLDLDKLWAHSVAVANAARRMMVKSKRPRVEQDITFLAGLLHDVGRLVLAQGRPKDYRALTRACGGLPDSEREIEVYGACHADVGAYLLGLWGLPEEAVEALAWHHQPGACPFRVCCTTTAVHIADAAHHAHVLGVDIQDLLDSEHIDALEPVLEMADMLDTCNAIFARNTTP